MGKKLSEKLLGLLGFEVEEVEEPLEIGEDWEKPVFSGGRKRKNNVVSLHSAQNLKIVVARPASFEQVLNFASDIKNRRPVVLNLEDTDAETARRIIDFMSGATYALEGTMQKISTYIFTFVPSNVGISGDIEDCLKVHK